MRTFSRRDLIKTGLLAPAAVAAAQGMGPLSPALEATAQEPAPTANRSSIPTGGRERLLLDFGWRFHFGHANDAAQDFGYGSGRTGNFQKTGSFLAPGNIAFDDSQWRPIDLPHDWQERPGEQSASRTQGHQSVQTTPQFHRHQPPRPGCAQIQQVARPNNPRVTTQVLFVSVRPVQNWTGAKPCRAALREINSVR
jgi:hypothetical protein